MSNVAFSVWKPDFQVISIGSKLFCTELGLSVGFIYFIIFLAQGQVNENILSYAALEVSNCIYVSVE